MQYKQIGRVLKSALIGVISSALVSILAFGHVLAQDIPNLGPLIPPSPPEGSIVGVQDSDFVPAPVSPIAEMSESEKKALQVTLDAEALLNRLAQIEPKQAASHIKDILDIFKNYSLFALEPQIYRPELALWRARALTSKKHQKNTAQAWRDYFEMIAAANGPQAIHLGYLFEAAEASARVGDQTAARDFLGEAKKRVEGDEGPSRLLDLHFMARELALTSNGRDWRAVEDDISDMKALLTDMPLWSGDWFEVLLTELQLRLEVEPEGAAKYEHLAQLKEDLTLAFRAQLIAPEKALKDRYRHLLRQLEDKYKL